MLLCSCTSVIQLQLGLGVGVIGAVYVPLGVPFVVSCIVVGKLTDKLVRLAYCTDGTLLKITPPLYGPKLFV